MRALAYLSHKRAVSKADSTNLFVVDKESIAACDSKTSLLKSISGLEREERRKVILVSSLVVF